MQGKSTKRFSRRRRDTTETVVAPSVPRLGLEIAPGHAQVRLAARPSPTWRPSQVGLGGAPSRTWPAPQVRLGRYASRTWPRAQVGVGPRPRRGARQVSVHACPQRLRPGVPATLAARSLAECVWRQRAVAAKDQVPSRRGRRLPAHTASLALQWMTSPRHPSTRPERREPASGRSQSTGRRLPSRQRWHAADCTPHAVCGVEAHGARAPIVECPRGSRVPSSPGAVGSSPLRRLWRCAEARVAESRWPAQTVPLEPPAPRAAAAGAGWPHGRWLAVGRAVRQRGATSAGGALRPMRERPAPCASTRVATRAPLASDRESGTGRDGGRRAAMCAAWAAVRAGPARAPCARGGFWRRRRARRPLCGLPRRVASRCRAPESRIRCAFQETHHCWGHAGGGKCIQHHK